ncbi:hypothetical protein EVAR_39975_1 [Eumeta japonica]|uniref:Uncharacterized protein n=1 Tax=Eumeta variegata TaxID=151549 RepID=A0A4C1YID4_EUMVA|nr:hypothetical protein EVAR_39975_1 [Eumeta japonica]
MALARDCTEMPHLLARPAGRNGWILQSCRRFEMLYVGCVLEAEVDIGVLRLRSDNSALHEVDSRIGLRTKPESGQTAEPEFESETGPRSGS